MKTDIPPFEEGDLRFLNREHADGEKKFKLCSEYLKHGFIKTAGAAIGVAAPSAERLLRKAAQEMRARKNISLAQRTHTLCVEIKDLVDDVPVKIRVPLVDARYLIVLDLCLADKGKILKLRNIGEKNLQIIEAFLKKHDLGFGMKIPTRTMHLVREAAVRNRHKERCELRKTL